jgi:radical SAM superfamily enzyme YgiQ (UPF0313 family)
MVVDMNNILLINPQTPDYISNKEYIMPPSLLYLSHHLQSTLTADVDILDYNTNPIGDNIDLDKYNYVGITNLFSGHFQTTLKLSKLIKEVNPKIEIVVGGIHPTIFHKEIINNCDSIDYVIIGEGEYSLRKLLTNQSTDGICYREDGKTIVKPKICFIEDVDTIAPPIQGYLNIYFNDYIYNRNNWYNPKGFDLSNSIEVPILTSRSCPNRCNFCSMFLVMGPKIRLRNPYIVVNEIEWLYYNYGIKMFSIMDDNVTLIKSHITTICQEIIRRKLDISWQTPNGLMINTLAPGVIDIMAESGWYRTMLAIESGNDYIRNEIMGKKLPKKKIYEIVEYIKKRHPHIYLRGLYIMGIPEENNQSLQDSLDMINNLPTNIDSVANLMPFPGTKVFDQAVRDKLFFEDVNTKDFWNEGRFDYNNNNRFYLKPYNMTKTQLAHWRQTFDNAIYRKSGVPQIRI